MKKIIFSIIIFAFIGKQSANSQDFTLDNKTIEKVAAEWSASNTNNIDEKSHILAFCGDTIKNSADKRSDERKKARELFEKKKLEFFTQEMELTEDEAKVFFPVFNQFQGKQRKIGQERRKLLYDFESKKATITDTEAKQMNNQLINLQKQEYDLTTEYQKTFETILAPKKLFLFHKAQEKFQRELLQSVAARKELKK